jgi:Tol biopolymer transport system component
MQKSRSNESLVVILGEWPYVLDLEQNQISALDSNLAVWHLKGLIWSPTNRHLAGVTSGNDQTLRILDRAGKSNTVFQVAQIPPAVSQSALQWSPDGQSWAWEDSRNFYFGNLAATSIYTVSADLAHMFDWAFNGKEVAFTRSADSKQSSRVFLISRGSNDVLELTNVLPLVDAHWITRPKWMK